MAKIRIYPEFFEQLTSVFNDLDLSSGDTLERVLSLIFWDTRKHSELIMVYENEKDKSLEAVISAVSLENMPYSMAMFMGIHIIDDRPLKFIRPSDYKEMPIPHFLNGGPLVLSVANRIFRDIIHEMDGRYNRLVTSGVDIKNSSEIDSKVIRYIESGKFEDHPQRLPKQGEKPKSMGKKKDGPIIPIKKLPPSQDEKTAKKEDPNTQSASN